MLANFKMPLDWGELVKRTAKDAIADDIMNLSAQQAYYLFFALFPALLTLISIASFFNLANVVEQVVQNVGTVAPRDVLTIVETQLAEIGKSGRGGILTGAFLLTIWSSSTAMVSITTTLNAAYDIEEGRPWWKVRLTAIALTVGMALFIIVSMALVLLGPTAAEHLATRMNLGEAFKWTWLVLQWPVVLTLVATGIAIVYYFAPDAEQEWVWITPGSVLATLLWLGVSLALKIYIANFANYNETYGAIGGVIVLLLWFWLSGMAILIGAEFNAEIEHASPHGKDVGEKVPGEKKKIGVLAARAYEEKRARGEIPVRAFDEGVNCDLEREAAAESGPGKPGPGKPGPYEVRPSDLIIGTAALIPAAIKIGKDIKKKIGRDAA